MWERAVQCGAQKPGIILPAPLSPSPPTSRREQTRKYIRDPTFFHHHPHHTPESPLPERLQVPLCGLLPSFQPCLLPAQPLESFEQCHPDPSSFSRLDSSSGCRCTQKSVRVLATFLPLGSPLTSSPLRHSGLTLLQPVAPLLFLRHLGQLCSQTGLGLNASPTAPARPETRSPLLSITFAACKMSPPPSSLPGSLIHGHTLLHSLCMRSLQSPFNRLTHYVCTSPTPHPTPPPYLLPSQVTSKR